MSSPAPLKPNQKVIQQYYETLKAYSDSHVTHEGATETAFMRLLADTAKLHGCLLVPKQGKKVAGKHIVPDGTVRDIFNLARGHWEAKDIDVEIAKKKAKGYPLTNIIFEDTRRAVHYQNKQEVRRFDLTQHQQLADLLNEFYAFTEPVIIGFEQAV